MQNLECTYYCSPDPHPYLDGTCSWCGDPECEELGGWDDVWLCKTCRKAERLIRTDRGQQLLNRPNN